MDINKIRPDMGINNIVVSVVKKINIFFYPNLFNRDSKKSLSDEPDLEFLMNI